MSLHPDALKVPDSGDGGVWGEGGCHFLWNIPRGERGWWVSAMGWMHTFASACWLREALWGPLPQGGDGKKSEEGEVPMDAQVP